MKPALGLASRLQRASLGAMAWAVGVVALTVLVGVFATGLLALQRAARVQALVLADSLGAAVAFQDVLVAQASLQSLERAPDVLAGQLSLSDGRLVARYSRTGEDWRGPVGAGAAHSTISFDRVVVQQPVQRNGTVVGWLTLAVGLSTVYWLMAWAAAALLLVCSLTTAAFAWRLRGLTAATLAPLAELQAVMMQVLIDADADADADAPRRARIGGMLEWDTLAASCKAMFEQIRLHDARLMLHRGELEPNAAASAEQGALAKQEAAAASAALREVLATLTHAIGTPMGAMLRMSELLVASALQPQQRCWAVAAQRSGRHLQGLITDIVDLASIDSGQLPLQLADFDLAAVVEETLATFSQVADTQGIELTVQFSPPDARLLLRGDHLRLRKVLMKLIGNAVKFTAAGEVAVHVTQREPLEGQALVTICVQDTGMGIATEAQARIFDHRSTAGGTNPRDCGGSGLGLTLCRRLVNLMGGSIRVESQIGRGALFVIDLPLPHAQGAANSRPLPAWALGGRKALVVDDNATVRDTLTRYLAALGLAATSTDDGEKAIKLMLDAAASDSPFDLVILDTQMPGMNGLHLGRAIRLRPALASATLVYAVSSLTEPDLLALQGETELCVRKPISRAALRQAVNRALTGSRPAPTATAPVVVKAPAGLQGRVLLVEDNPINQRVGTILLQKLGLSCVVAENGALALERLRASHFDLVLMDCQMPVMDGYNATAEIRRLPGLDADHLPIIALTANVIGGDEQRCLDAGMNAFLGKPYSLAALRHAVEPWLKPAPAEAASMATVWPAAESMGHSAAIAP